ncbi:MAG: YdcH family protein [Alphaproteobacteria bacterium]|nr:YdcH family protein [Alphaproteobacteria bacterium]
MNDDVVILKQLDELREQHRKLDSEISQLVGTDNEFRLAQLKKQKLRMRDQISMLEMEMFPDQPA